MPIILPTILLVLIQQTWHNQCPPSSLTAHLYWYISHYTLDLTSPTVHLYWYSTSPSSSPTGLLVLIHHACPERKHLPACLYWYDVMPSRGKTFHCVCVICCDKNPDEESADKISYYLNELPICFTQTLRSSYEKNHNNHCPPFTCIDTVLLPLHCPLGCLYYLIHPLTVHNYHLGI